MFGHAANRLQAVRARGVGGARGLTIFSEDARAMKPESYPWETRRAHTARTYSLQLTLNTHCTAVLTRDMPSRARKYRTTYHRTKAQNRRNQNPGAWILHT